MKENRRGFTLIEIVIVLAIAALILIIVFLAVQGAQKSQKDNVSRRAASRVISAYSTYMGNSNNQAPVIANFPTDISGYLTGIVDGRGVSPVFFFDGGPGPQVDYATPTTFVFSIRAFCVRNGAPAAGGVGDSINEVIGTTSFASIAVAYWSETAKKSVCIQG